MVYFQNKNPNLGNFLMASQFEDAGIFYAHLVYFTAILYTLWTFGIFCGNLVHFTRFRKLNQEKSGNPGSHCWFLALHNKS
jgi:hypothetical protein